MNLRLKVFALGFAFSVLLLIIRLGYWQVVSAGTLAKQGKLQYESQVRVSAIRGSILASDGTWLATNTPSWVVYASRPDIKDKPRDLANKLAPFFVDDAKKENALLDEAMRLEGVLGQDGIWIALKHKVPNDVKKNIEAMRIPGIKFEEEDTRLYPEGSSSAQVLGFVGKDDQGMDKGYFGLEGYYDLTLAGKAGYTKRESDAKGVPILFGNSKEVAPVAGVDLATNIDKTVQLTIEKYLQKAIEDYGAKGGTVIVMRPQDGAVMGLVSTPAYDPGKYWDYSDQVFRDPAISDTFEPGSIFKPIAMSAGLDAGVIKPDTICDICDKALKIDKYEIKTWNDKYTPNSTMTDVIVHSDNVGMSFVGQKLGADKLYDYLSKFGFGHITGVDLQGEVNPELRERGTWSDVDVATGTFGQGIAVTPMQMIRAIAAIANGGVMMKPHIVNSLEKGDWEEKVKIDSGERVISQKASDEIKEMMVAAVRDGEAKWAVPQGFKIAGKTGTAQIPVAGHYDPSKTIASFVGFAPADNPKFVMLVTLREPQTSIWGSETAAPTWFNIAKELFPYLGVQPEN